MSSALVNKLLDMMHNNREIAVLWNYFASVVPVFGIWALFEMGFKFVVNVFTGKSYFGKKDFRLERYSR